MLKTYLNNFTTSFNLVQQQRFSRDDEQTNKPTNQRFSEPDFQIEVFDTVQPQLQGGFLVAHSKSQKSVNFSTISSRFTDTKNLAAN